MNQEIHFLAEEIDEKLNKDVEKILFQLRNPLSGKRNYIIKRFTEELIRASANKRIEIEEEPKVIEIEVQEVKPAEEIIEIKPEEIEHEDVPEFKQEVLPAPVSNFEEEKSEFSGYQPSVLEKKKEKIEEHRKIIQVNLIIHNETGEILVSGELEENEYRIYEPILSDDEMKLLRNAKNILMNDLDSLADKKTLWKILRKTSKQLNVYFDDDNFIKLRYYLIRDLMGYGSVEAFVHDKFIEKIICGGKGERIMVIRQNQKYRTNVIFKSFNELNDFINTIAERTYKKISMDEPTLDSIYRGFRIQGTLGTDVIPGRFIIERVG